MNEHPNATAAGLSGACTTVIVWAVDQFGINMPLYVAGAIVTVVSAGVLFFAGPKKRRRA